MNQKNWVVYLIWCANHSLYCGISNQPAVRFKQHQNGKGAKYTRAYLAQEMRIVCCCLSRSEALKMEWAMKKMTRSQKLALWKNARQLGD